MRIVQTFWSAGRDPLEYGFGWLRPEYNLMSWTLSCLSLREHYDEVALYTDEQGKHVLIDLLHLPYTEVNVVYDETLCPPQHWSYAKIKTYSLQTKPFLHIDGDIYLPRPISEDIVSAPLIVQSKERGTEYYRQIMDRLMSESSLELPEYLRRGLKEESIASYNMGLFGGNDLSFIHAFCEEALNICDSNKARCSDGNFNLLFEQMLFAYKTQEQMRGVSTVFSQTFNDNGYTAKEFCLLYEYRHRNYFHLLGGHKRNPDIVASLEEALLLLYPDSYRNVASLFPAFHPRGVPESLICLLMMDSDIPVCSYIEFLNDAEKDWGNITWEDLAATDTSCAKGKALAYGWDEKDTETMICSNPYLKCFDVPPSWDEEAKQIMRKRLSAASDAPIEKVAVIPTLSSKIRKEYVLYELEWQLLEQVKGHAAQVSDLLNTLTSKSEEMRPLWLNEIKILLNEGILITNN